MSLQKQCADFLRAYYHSVTGAKLGAGHAHELAAAYFGYSTAAALRAEAKYPLEELGGADILIPDLNLLEQRMKQLEGLATNLPSVDDLASALGEFLIAAGAFSGQIWQTWDLADYINADFIQKDTSIIENDLAGEIAITNAYYDELYVDDVNIATGPDALVATASGNLNGENDPDKGFFGDSIAFKSVITLYRVAGRVAFKEPRLETSGAVDTSRYDDAGA